MSPDARQRLAELEARRPDPEKLPDQFRKINEEISRLIDEERAFRQASNGFRVA